MSINLYFNNINGVMQTSCVNCNNYASVFNTIDDQLNRLEDGTIYNKYNTKSLLILYVNYG